VSERERERESHRAKKHTVEIRRVLRLYSLVVFEHCFFLLPLPLTPPTHTHTHPPLTRNRVETGPAVTAER